MIAEERIVFACKELDAADQIFTEDRPDEPEDNPADTPAVEPGDMPGDESSGGESDKSPCDIPDISIDDETERKTTSPLFTAHSVSCSPSPPGGIFSPRSLFQT